MYVRHLGLPQIAAQSTKTLIPRMSLCDEDPNTVAALQLRGHDSRCQYVAWQAKYVGRIESVGLDLLH